MVEVTPRDTHVYDVSSLTRNNGSPLAAPDLSGGYGILGVTVVSGSDSFLDEAFLTGNTRIVDGSGYEYRTNLVGADDTSPESRYTAHFNNVDGSSSADFIVIGIDYITSPGGFIPVTEEYFVRLHDVDENPISCPNAVIGCVEGNINVGINQTVTNSRDGASVCLGTDAVGYIEIDADDDGVEDDDISDAYIHFMGLNNNAGTGSMDSAVATDFLDNNVE